MLWPEKSNKLQEAAEPSGFLWSRYLRHDLTAQSRQSLGPGVGETHGLDWAETDSGKSFMNRDPQSWRRVPNITLVCLVADL